MFARRKFIAVTIATSLLCAPLFASAADEFQLKFGHDQAPEHAYNLAATYFADKVKEKTNGKVSIKVFPNATLGKEGDMLDSLSMGTLDFSISSTSNASSHVPQFGMLSVSYLFDNKDQLGKAAVDPTIVKRYQDLVVNKKLGFQMLTLMPNGLRNLYTTKPVKSIQDIQGMKVRVMPSPIESQVWSALGTKPTSVPFSDVYTALQTDLVSGAENTVSSFGQAKHNEVAKYYTLTGHQWLMTIIWASNKTMDKLPEQFRKAVRESAVEAAMHGFKMQLENDDKYTKELQAKGVTVSEVDRKPFAERVVTLQDQIAKELKTEDILARVRALK